MGSKKFMLSAGTGLLLGVVASILTGQWWLLAVGLALGAGGGAGARSKQ
ncbi:hypothetical protein [Actinomadura alba]|uniref:Uncharacterized protein n=1 Tax=Actinomadura alba TaxID=406431 RepID=A0ABR7M3T9_9ACTN|nr:hypothetical protein [Actinomadura alba]MBC6471372.1 hypothetical protein [Actinomadura alba]